MQNWPKQKGLMKLDSRQGSGPTDQRNMTLTEITELVFSKDGDLGLEYKGVHQNHF